MSRATNPVRTLTGRREPVESGRATMIPLRSSMKGEYALRAVLDLTLEQSGPPVKIGAIARRQRIPRKFLEAILTELKQGGFVESRRGAEGGYLLARSPEQITAGDVLRWMEGKRDSGAVSAGEETEGPFTPMWRRIGEAVSGILDNMTIAEVAAEWRDRQAALVPNWEI